MSNKKLISFNKNDCSMSRKYSTNFDIDSISSDQSSINIKDNIPNPNEQDMINKIQDLLSAVRSTGFVYDPSNDRNNSISSSSTYSSSSNSNSINNTDSSSQNSTNKNNECVRDNEVDEGEDEDEGIDIEDIEDTYQDSSNDSIKDKDIEKQSVNWNLALQFVCLVNCTSEKELKETIESIKVLLNSGNCDVDKPTKEKMFNLIGKMLDDLENYENKMNDKYDKYYDNTDISGLEALRFLREEYKMLGCQVDDKTEGNISELINKVGKAHKYIKEPELKIFKENLQKLQNEICVKPPLNESMSQSTICHLNELVNSLAVSDFVDSSYKIYKFTSAIHKIFKEIQKETNTNQKEMFKRYFVKIGPNKYRPRMVKIVNMNNDPSKQNYYNYTSVPLISLINQKVVSMKELHINFSIDPDKTLFKKHYGEKLSKCCECDKIKVDVSFVASDLPSGFSKFGKN